MSPQEPRLSCPAERERSAAKDKEIGGQYVAVCSVSKSPLTHNPVATLSQPFPIKWERYIFLKKSVRSSLLLILLPHVYVYSCICITAMQHLSVILIYTGSLGRVFAYGPGDRGSIPGRVIPKTLKMVLDNSLLNTQQYKVRIKDKVEQSRERSCALAYTSVK